MENKHNYWYYFRDLVDKDSEDYNRIVVLEAENDEDAWKDLSIRHENSYGKTKRSAKDMYKFLEKREI